jgi:hypothetical protein
MVSSQRKALVRFLALAPVALPVALAACSSAATRAPGTTAHAATDGQYAHLSDTGIDDEEVTPFAPQYPLWSDGATKRRWVYLPGQIDTSDMDRWVFPKGTKFWKEFSFKGHKIETRFIEKVGDGVGIDAWTFQTYKWNADETDAVLVAAGGEAEVADIGAKGGHDIEAWHSLPSRSVCRDCHDKGGDPVLGFTALQLSDDRDPNAPHADELTEEMLTLHRLDAKGLLKTPPPVPAPRIQANGDARAAIGYLHGNCSSCHNPESGRIATMAHGAFARLHGPAAPNFFHSVAGERAETLDDTGSAEPAYVTTVGRPTIFWQEAIDDANAGKRHEGANVSVARETYMSMPECVTKDSKRIVPGSASCSEIYQRISHRSPFSYLMLLRDGKATGASTDAQFEAQERGLATDEELPGFTGFEPLLQMPPAATKVVDTTAVATVERWITSLR